MNDIGRILEFRISQTIRIRKRIIYTEQIARIIKEEFESLKKESALQLKDEQIILGITTLDDLTLREIYRKSYPEVERMIQQNGGGIEDAKDVFQMAVMLLMEKVKQGRYNEKSTIYTYLYSLAKNIWSNESKKIQRRNTIFVYDKLDTPSLKRVIEKGGMIDIERPEEFDNISKWLKGLSENCIKLIEAWLYENQDWKTIAKSVGYANARSAQKQKHKCLQKLREENKV